MDRTALQDRITHQMHRARVMPDSDARIVWANVNELKELYSETYMR